MLCSRGDLSLQVKVVVSCPCKGRLQELQVLCRRDEQRLDGRMLLHRHHPSHLMGRGEIRHMSTRRTLISTGGYSSHQHRGTLSTSAQEGHSPHQHRRDTRHISTGETLATSVQEGRSPAASSGIHGKQKTYKLSKLFNERSHTKSLKYST